MLAGERKREFFESACIQYFLEQSREAHIYINKFHVSLRNSKLYNWSLRRDSTIISINHDAWTMSFVIVISSKGIEGIKAHINSNNSEIFTWFCEDVWRRLTDGDERTQTPVIIWDNASLRIWKESTEFMKSKRTKRITITLYSHRWAQQRK